MNEQANPTRHVCSVILSVHNEEANLRPLYDQLVAVADREPMDWEFVFVDDGSRDRSYEILTELNARDPRVKAIRFTRNFGAQETTVAGLRECRGDVAIIMASDLQDPPEVITSFLAKWREGFHIVWGVRASREDPALRRLVADAYYWFIRKLALPNFPQKGTGGFCLMSRPVIDVFNSLEERNRVFFEMLVWSGFPSAEVLYERPARQRGQQNWTFARNIKAAVDSVLALSYAPVRWVSLLGCVCAVISLTMGCYLLLYALIYGIRTTGWASLIVTLLFLSGVQLLSLGLLGEYLWRILQESRRRPLYLVLDRLGGDRPGSPRQGSSGLRIAAEASANAPVP